MESEPRTPEELESMLEDAFVIRDPDGLAQLFGDGAVLSVGNGLARGEDEIARLAKQLWESGHTYLAESQRVLQARATALVVADRGIHVMHRGGNGTWRYAISLLSLDDPKEEP